ncbi:Putative SET domain-containing protein [Colletotrichum destructivum]|uniref:SET domain-containing protein n=1 Tax=Colletotrichum destructivum TaxID=34406 RepID=A0AAX4IBL5_9PEZI|nr:Putative SET domain-containing protein [Colletotrichum destructivum]
MHYGNVLVLVAVIYTVQVFCSDPSILHMPNGGQDAQKLVASKDGTGLCYPRGQLGFDLHTLQQHNRSADQQSACVWSDSRKQHYCVFADPQFDYGKGITMITTAERARHIFKSNASVANRTSSARVSLFRTNASGRKGRGICSNSHIPAGSLITQESPILFLDANWMENTMSEEDLDTLQALAIEKLPEITRQAVHELYGGPDTDSLKEKIWTNGYGVSGGPTKNWPGLNDEMDSGMIAVHANISLTERQKINHSCRPNAAPQWNWDILAHKLYAVRDIAPGEEITMPYFDTIKTFQERQHHCKASQFADLSDDRINEIVLLEQSLENRQIAPAEPTAMAELLVSLYKQEGLDSFISKAYAIAAREWNGAGYEYQARSWAYQSVKAGLIAGSVGLKQGDLEDMEALLDGARKHWSWRYRVHQ